MLTCLQVLWLVFGQVLVLAFLPCLQTHPFSLQTKPGTFSLLLFDLVTIFPGPRPKF